MDSYIDDYITEMNLLNQSYSNTNHYNRYNAIIAEEGMGIIKSELEKLGEKYNFECHILLNGLYSDKNMCLYKSSIKGPFKIEIKDDRFNFLKDKTYECYL